MNLSDATAASRLLRNALNPKDRPTPDSEYRELLDRYKTDTAFAELVERIAEGLGLDVHPPSTLGLLVSGRIESPFAITLENSGLPVRTPTEQRLQDRRCFGLVLLAIAAYAYPHGEALLDPASLPVRPIEIERFLEQRISRLTELDSDPDQPEGQLREAAATWKDLPAYLPTDKQRIARDCHRWYVNKTLDFLVVDRLLGWRPMGGGSSSRLPTGVCSVWGSSASSSCRVPQCAGTRIGSEGWAVGGVTPRRWSASAVTAAVECCWDQHELTPSPAVAGRQRW